MKYLPYWGCLLILFCTACSSNSTDADNSEVADSEGTQTESSCEYKDGTYSASVDYYNPDTDYSATYTLDVEVEDCQVVQINFPSGGWLDEDHITPADIDSNGNASVEGEDGKTYDVQL